MRESEPTDFATYKRRRIDGLGNSLSREHPHDARDFRFLARAYHYDTGITLLKESSKAIRATLNGTSVERSEYTPEVALFIAWWDKKTA